MQVTRLPCLLQTVLEITALVMTCLIKQGTDAALMANKHMDKPSECVHMTVYNDDLEEGDYYLVSSDHYQGTADSDWQRYPAECTQTYQLEDRRVWVTVEVWQCTRALDEPYLELYKDCDGRHRDSHQLQLHLNCSHGENSSQTEVTIHTDSACITLYHYRGTTQAGYHFQLKVTAGPALLSFSVAGGAAIFVLCVVGVLCTAKVFCFITGYERRLPNIDFEVLYEEQKAMLESMAVSGAGTASGSGDTLLGVIQPHDVHVQPRMSVSARGSLSQTGTDSVSTDSPSPKTSKSTMTTPAPTTSTLHPSTVEPSGGGHKALRLSRSTGSSVSGRSSRLPSLEEAISEVDLDAYLELDMEPHPRLKRYPSAKASSMFRHK